ncbi:hypothetical protein BpHYR1_034772 [Brachionus plicatilis]|uniref:Uncharacterized protein n=1 Tax=Brachionus plicatilis TaxID=10195 RepID=A0A3M7S1V4_BRAPC|nr:hypothetical protein BpHYR1_034772 [Brachionus plicatilis]
MVRDTNWYKFNYWKICLDGISTSSHNYSRALFKQKYVVGYLKAYFVLGLKIFNYFPKHGFLSIFVLIQFLN